MMNITCTQLIVENICATEKSNIGAFSAVYDFFRVCSLKKKFCADRLSVYFLSSHIHYHNTFLAMRVKGMAYK